MHYQIFVPGRLTDGKGWLKEAGMTDFAMGVGEAVVTINSQKGLLLTWGRQNLDDSASLDWVDVEATGTASAYMIGFPVGVNRCGPEELQKPELFSGYYVRLGDGNQWICPAAAQLPHSLKFTAGRWQKHRQARFDEYWTKSAIWFNRFMEHDLEHERIMNAEGLTAEALLQEWAEFVVFALRQNYRINNVIASELGLFDERSIAAVTRACIDSMPIMEAMWAMNEHMDAVTAGLKKKPTASE